MIHTKNVLFSNIHEKHFTLDIISAQVSCASFQGQQNVAELAFSQLSNIPSIIKYLAQ